MALFTGTHEMRIDGKGRLTVPARFRDLLGAEAVAACGFDGCLELRRAEEFAREAERLLALPYDDPAQRARVRRVFGSAAHGTFDALGRLLLPKALLAHAGLSRDALVTGVGDRAEVWSPERYATYARDRFLA